MGVAHGGSLGTTGEIRKAHELKASPTLWKGQKVRGEASACGALVASAGGRAEVALVERAQSLDVTRPHSDVVYPHIDPRGKVSRRTPALTAPQIPLGRRAFAPGRRAADDMFSATASRM